MTDAVTSETVRAAGGDAPAPSTRHSDRLAAHEAGRHRRASTQVRSLDAFRTQRENGLTSRGHGSKR